MRTLLSSLMLSLLVPVAAHAQEWRVIDSWSGSGQLETQTFRVSSSEWRVDWEATPSGDYGSVFQVYVYRGDGTLVTLAANVANQGGTSVSYVHAPPGEFYLMMNAANVNWSVEAEEPR